ncbi:hypothetical protein ORD22_14905 [Sporosarcina sp. GW1-11]|uniref:hypothetical protein n=1 Tax=Sporosarcina sp. GW1-11 TaxID=2899126 RepID=UPI00294E846D|nr:hypothetical protein [Sporosarcina sp. GW1-11]MDV6379503.1 hypothetical protein [Sporosarcina sp. GW1-11]
MTEHDRKKIIKKKEMRTKEISKMISEGGLGSDKYYDIKKVPPTVDSIQADDTTGVDEDK